ncbi:MAG: VC0807 family protein [Pseudohongiellaceae bacterium]
MTSSMNTTAQKPENPWVNILFNIIIPVIILNQLTRRLDENGPVIALVVALLFPLGYGIYDYLTRGKKNWLSLLGLVNVSFTGGMGLFQLEGIWFAIKEASFPADRICRVCLRVYPQSTDEIDGGRHRRSGHGSHPPAAGRVR